MFNCTSIDAGSPPRVGPLKSLLAAASSSLCSILGLSGSPRALRIWCYLRARPSYVYFAAHASNCFAMCACRNFSRSLIFSFTKDYGCCCCSLWLVSTFAPLVLFQLICRAHDYFSLLLSCQWQNFYFSTNILRVSWHSSYYLSSFPNIILWHWKISASLLACPKQSSCLFLVFAVLYVLACDPFCQTLHCYLGQNGPPWAWTRNQA